MAGTSGGRAGQPGHVPSPPQAWHRRLPRQRVVDDTSVSVDAGHLLRLLPWGAPRCGVGRVRVHAQSSPPRPRLPCRGVAAGVWVLVPLCRDHSPESGAPCTHAGQPVLGGHG